MLIRRTALDKIGGVVSLKSAIIDDCALARALKNSGPIWLGLSEDTESIRAYNQLGTIWQMVTRSAFEQLSNSFIMLCITVIGMMLIYLAPPAMMQLSLLWDATIPMLMAGAAWALMAFLSTPTFRLYGLSPVYGLLLPIAGLLYLLMTIDSARRYWLRKGATGKVALTASPNHTAPCGAASDPQAHKPSWPRQQVHHECRRKDHGDL